MRRMRNIFAALTLVVAAPLLAAPLFAADDVTVIRAARLIDGTGAAPIANAVVVVTGNKITAVGSNLPAPTGAKVIDLSNATVLPGLIE